MTELERRRRTVGYYYEARFHAEYIMYIRYENNAYSVWVRNEDGTRNYLVYGGYRAVGLAENRLLASAQSYRTNPVEYKIGTREVIQEGAYWRQ
jgi:hypothetical protein